MFFLRKKQIRKLKGSHGTSKESAASIKSTGVFQTTPGLLGKASYFWGGNEQYLNDLAEGWARYKFLNNDDIQSIVVILTDITAHADEVFDVGEEIRLAIADLMEKQGVNKSDTKNISKTYDVVVQRTEKKLGRNFKVIKGEIPLVPKEYYRKEFPYDILRGQGTCYAVRDTKIIKLKNSYEITP